MFDFLAKTGRRAAPRRRTAAALLAGAAATALLATPLSAQTLKVVMHSSLRVLDPIITTAYMSRNHGYMVFDTLFALDEEYNIKPQMAEGYTVSDDGLTYTITLRDGLLFHDGAPVTATDVIASLKRWGERDGMGQKLMSQIASWDAPDDKTVVITLSEPYGLLMDSIAKPSSNVPFIMPARLAETPSTEGVPEQIGSGPFKFVQDEFQPGVKAVYEKFEEYVPRDEPPSWASGGKVVKVDRVEWIVMADAQTAMNAIMSGEIDYWEAPPYDLLPVLETVPDLTIHVINKMGSTTIGRYNFLHPPFDDLKVRQAAMIAMNQQDVMDAMIGNPDYYTICGAMFMCGTPLETEVGAEGVMEKDDLDKAKALLAESSYDGTPLVIMHPTDVGSLRTQPVVAAQAFRDAGFNVDLQAMDWQTLVGRRASQAPISENGWNMFFTTWVGADVFNPIANNMVNGKGSDGGWFGWPDMPEAEELRDAYAKAATVEEQKEIAEKLQAFAYENAMYIPLGQFTAPAAWTGKIEGVLDGPAPFFWNISKSE
ncbi:ABC transporter substrate-binding protein [Albimonas pacifica]|uniref:Peptide/nickel transport system substrate-binding protein n=1 Tax=Albimonas pacifica TaxID=1114924 RepID=A0A1I3ED78_9RHOB|nr:ABC transporter substrate-binding protein [Albimonas pacifica]SFH96940.1 peptide/nickel transport system substrate-binding protein [Albimonas pacifica]